MILQNMIANCNKSITFDFHRKRNKSRDMAEIIKMPRLSDTMEEGNIISWLKKVGDQVSPGDILAEVETDKATMDLESFHEGYLLHIGVAEGAVPVDGVIAVIGEKGEDFQAQLDAASAGATSGAKAEEKPAPAAEPAAQKSDPAPSSSGMSAAHDDQVKASPLAKKMAAENNINLSGIKGSGDNGRIVKKDVEAAIAGGNAAGATAAPVQYFSGQTEEVPVSQMRKAIARRLSESKFQAPHFYLTIECNMARTIDARKAFNNLGTGKISFNDIVIKACAMALRKHPMINSSWMGDKIVKHGEINIGVAVAVEEGLLVPVVRNADQKPMSIINAEVREYAGRAKDKRLKPDEMSGNTFTISNLGMFGIEEFTAIINPPDACILAVGTIVQKPVVQDGQIVVGNMMKLTLSCDHRVVDGAKGAEFLQTVKSNLDNPLSMLA